MAEYRKPEINLQVNFAGGSFVYGQNLPVQVEARYFFDAPAGNMPLYWSLSVTPDSFSLPGYQTGPFDRGWLNLFQYPGFFSGSVGYMLAQGDGRTDPDGRFALDLPTVVREELVNPAVRQRYTLEVTLTDESGLPVSARASTLVDPAGIYIGVQPDLWLGQAGQAGGYRGFTREG